MTDRAYTKKATETEVLFKSRRICALCYGLNQDTVPKKGQIAHIDEDSSNASLDNLVYLCLRHHDEYDSTTSQSKGITEQELRKHRSYLYERNENIEAHSSQNGGRPHQMERGHDRTKYQKFESWLTEETFIRIHYNLGINKIEPDDFSILDSSNYLQTKPSFRFLDPTLRRLCEHFLVITSEVTQFIAFNFDVPDALKPGSYQKLSPNKYNDETHRDYDQRFQRNESKLVHLNGWFEATYCRFRWEVQEKLYI